MSSVEQLEDTLAGADVALSDEILDRIDAIVPPGESIGAMDMVYRGPEVADAALRRRPSSSRSALLREGREKVPGATVRRAGDRPVQQ